MTDVRTNLTERLEEEPQLDIAGIWRDGTKPPGGIAVNDLEHYTAMLEERGRRCACVNIRVGAPGIDRDLPALNSEIAHAMSGGRA